MDIVEVSRRYGTWGCIQQVHGDFVHRTDNWLVFPHELQGLTEEEVAAYKPLALVT